MNLGAFAAAVGVACMAWSAGALGSPECRASHERLDLGHPLGIAKTGVVDHKELRVLAMGSSSTQGYGASNPQFAYPAQLQMRLTEAMPGVAVRVFNKGIGRQAAGGET